MIAIELSESIRTIASDKLQRNISLKRMQRKLNELFVDWKTKENQRNLFESDDGIRKVMKYNKCNSLNDERTIKFHQSWKQESDVFDETRQIWIDRNIDPIEDDLFIPRDDAQ